MAWEASTRRGCELGHDEDEVRCAEVVVDALPGRRAAVEALGRSMQTWSRAGGWWSHIGAHGRAMRSWAGGHGRLVAVLAWCSGVEEGDGLAQMLASRCSDGLAWLANTRFGRASHGEFAEERVEVLLGCSRGEAGLMRCSGWGSAGRRK